VSGRPHELDLGRVAALEHIIRDWLNEPELLVLTGRWSDGAVMELVPAAPARLTRARYEGRFAGLRDLLLDGAAHHVHLDLGRLTRATYLVSPSVCFGFRPSFEVRLHAGDSDPLDRFALGFGLRWPYRAGKLAPVAVARYFERFRSHRVAFPGVASLVAIDPPAGAAAAPALDWQALGKLVTGASAEACRNAAELAQLFGCDDEVAA
jgi:hypothetical protein